MKYFLPLLALLLFQGCGNDVVTTESGLRYSDIKSGEGRAAQEGDLVTFNVLIWTVQDSSDLFEDWSADTTKKEQLIASTKEYNQPAKVVLGTGAFVRGSDEGIVGMKPGGERMIVIPHNLAYGQTGAGPVPPNTDLKLLVEMIDVKEVPQVEPWDYDSTKTQTTPSGLMYIILEEGTGENADSNDIVSVHYSGFLVDGTKFDSSVERDEPLTFTIGVGQVIPGWDEGITLLNKGAKAKLIIPPFLAYGERDMGSIPPNSTLIFDVELVDVKKN
jgi:peptidylprolyl isomerase